MLLREALRILGRERVLKGMEAIDNSYTSSNGSSCFIGRAFGGNHGYVIAKSDVGLIGEASLICEAFYEGYIHKRSIVKELPSIDFNYESYTKLTRSILREECIIFLAESGTEAEETKRESKCLTSH